MIQTFANRETERVYVAGQSKYLPSDLVRRATRRLEYIDLVWDSLLHGDDLEGWDPDDPRVWSRDGDALVIDAAGLNELNALTYQKGN